MRTSRASSTTKYQKKAESERAGSGSKTNLTVMASVIPTRVYRSTHGASYGTVWTDRQGNRWIADEVCSSITCHPFPSLST
jgi:hypothetical protein